MALERQRTPRTILPAHCDRSRTAQSRARLVAARHQRRRSRAARDDGGILMGWWHGLRERMSAWTRPAARDRDLDAEIAHHLDLEVDRLERAGLSPGDARRQALQRFGHLADIVESTRAARRRPSTEGIVQDLRYAFRALRKQFAFSAVALATLALGIGATSTAFAV